MSRPGLQNTGLFMIVEFKILWYYELTIPCVAFEKSFNVCLVFPRSRTLQIDQSIVLDNTRYLSID